MQYTKARYDLIFIMNPLTLMLGYLCFFYWPTYVINFFKVFWICAVAALFVILTPFGHHRLAKTEEDVTSRLPWQQWIFCILLLEIALFCVYLGMCAISGNFFTVNTAPQSSLFLTNLSQALIHQGLFPWAFYAILSVGFGMLAYTKETDAYCSNLLQPLMRHTPQEVGGLIVNMSMRRCTMYAFSVLIFFMSLLFMTLLITPKTHIITGFQPAALVTTLFLFVVILTKKTKQLIAKLFSRHIPMIVAYPLFAIAICFLTLFINTLCAGLIPSNPSSTSVPSLVSQWIKYDWLSSWSIFSNLFWICLTVPVCGYITKISKGYCIRQMIIGVLFFPMCIAALLVLRHPSPGGAEFLSPLAIKILSCMSFVIVLPLLLNHQNSANAILAYFPKKGLIKYRDEQRFFKETTRITVILLYLYLVIGMNAISTVFSLLLIIIPPILLVTVCVIIKNILTFRKN